MRPIEILLVDDDEGDIKLTRRALEKDKLRINIHVARDGAEAMSFLKKEGAHAASPKPDMILLDLNMPRKDGRQTLGEIKSNDDLKDIPIIILTTSASHEDVVKSYKDGCNCFVTKPVDLKQFTKIIQTLKEFWFAVVKLPQDD